jgi:hypothetical protein
MNRKLKNIVVKCIVFTLSLLMTDACPDFTDSYADFSDSKSEYSIVEYLMDCVTGDLLNSHHTIPSDSTSSSHERSLEIDAFLVVNHKVSTHFILFLAQLESIYHTPFSDVVIDIIPMPPTLLG